MKKKLIAAAMAAALAFSLSAAALAAKGGVNDKAAIAPSVGNFAKGGDTEQRAVRERLKEKIAVSKENRAEILKIRAQNTRLSAQLRALMNKANKNGVAIPEETVAAMNAIREQLKARYGELEATRGDIEPLLETYRECRRTGDFEKAAEILDQIATVQQSRIQIMSGINELLQDLVDLLSGALEDQNAEDQSTEDQNAEDQSGD